jgi:hypothetical protein
VYEPPEILETANGGQKMDEPRTSSRGRRRITVVVLAVVIGIAVFAISSWTPRRTPADDAIEFVRLDGKVAGNAQCTRLPILEITLKNEFHVTEASFPVARLTDEMVKQLVKLDDLQSIMLLDANALAGAPQKVALADLELAASGESIAALQKKFPGLAVYVGTIAEPAPTR